jgi:hypothetical protein
MIDLLTEQLAHEKTKVELYKSQFQLLDLIGRQALEKIAHLEKQIDTATPKIDDQ